MHLVQLKGPSAYPADPAPGHGLLSIMLEELGIDGLCAHQTRGPVWPLPSSFLQEDDAKNSLHEHGAISSPLPREAPACHSRPSQVRGIRKKNATCIAGMFATRVVILHSHPWLALC